MSKQRLYHLLEVYFNKRHTPEERSELFQLLAAPENETVVKEWINNGFSNELTYKIDPEASEDILQAIFTIQPDSHVNRNETTQPVEPGRSRYFMRTVWLRYAAAILIILGAVAYFRNANKKPDQPIVSANKPLPADVSPGGNKASLTLADGTVIALDDAANDTIAEQGNARVVKLANGQIAYQLKGKAQGEILMNTMTTPTGGQYRLILPDGTKVWLNAASSITYPTAFTEPTRRVKITGEVYFEVTKNAAKPFHVSSGTQDIEVLGTHFNVNAYEDESSINTTLLEGRVKVNSAIPYKSGQAGNPQQVATGWQSAILKPGEQASVSPTSPSITVHQADVAQVLAWKDGIFDFTGADLKTVMRQLERWYDIRVQYKGAGSNMTFDGRMYRNVNLSNVLDFLKEAGLKFRMEGRNLIVL